MMEAMSNNWQSLAFAHSPTGSVDSGVELSPSRSFPYATYEDCCTHFTNQGSCPESPIYQTGTPPLSAETNVAYPAEQFPLTPDELDALSDTADTLALSPCSVGQQAPSIEDLTDIGQFHSKRTETPGIDSLPLSLFNSEPSINTLKRKRREKARFEGLREAHPGVDPCLVPKSGTAKPRQSRKKRKPGAVESMAGATGPTMNTRKGHLGARVKETAREKLQKIRRQMSDGMDSKQRTQALPQATQPPFKRQDTGGEEIRASFGMMYPTSQPATSITQTTQPYIPHSVNQILSTATQGYARDNLDDIISSVVQHQNTSALEEYADHVNRSYTSRGETTLCYILNRLNEKKDMFPVKNIHIVTKIVCRLFPNDINAENLQGETPIYRAALFGNEGAVHALMDMGANPWLKERTAGENALHAAVRSKSLIVVRAILDKMRGRGELLVPEINSKTYDGNTPLHKAAALPGLHAKEQEAMILELIRAGADTTIKNHMSQMAHSFLPESLKEVQNHIKRLNGRKRALAHQAMSANASQIEAGPYYSPVYPAQYSHQLPPELIQTHLPHSAHALARHQQYVYDSAPQSCNYFPPACGQPSYPTIEPVSTSATIPSYEPRTTVTGSMPHHSANLPNQEDDLENIFYHPLP